MKSMPKINQLQFDFERLDMSHAKEAMDIYNFYAENSFAAYPDKRLPYEFFGKFIDMTRGFPAYSVFSDGKMVGFCFLRAYNPFTAFKATAEITYFIDKDFSGKGIGRLALAKLENEARKMGIKNILASITSLNKNSLTFHTNNGFVECGRFLEVGQKFGNNFDIVWMQKKM